MTPTPQERFLAHLDTIREVVETLCRRRRLDEETGDELRSYVRLRLVENDYGILARFRGESSFRTYLVTVVHRLFLDFCNREWGRWRPSAAARGMGALAIELERLVTRDGLSDHEAIGVILTREGRRTDRSRLEAILADLPRPSRPSEVALDSVAPPPVPEAETSSEVRLVSGELLSAAERALARGLSRLPPQDVLILRLRFASDRTIADIARLLELEQRPLYRRVERALRALREELAAAGIGRRDAADLLATRLPLSLDFSSPEWKSAATGTSYPLEKETRDDDDAGTSEP